MSPSDPTPAPAPPSPSMAIRVAAAAGSAQGIALALVAVALLVAGAAAGRSSSEFHQLAQFFDMLIAAVIAVVAIALGASALLLSRRGWAPALLGLAEVPVVVVSVLLRTQPGSTGSLAAPISTAVGVLVLACLISERSRLAAAGITIAAAVALVVLGRPPIPTFGPPPTISEPGLITFDAFDGCRFEVAPRAGSRARPLPCDAVGAAAERQAMSTRFDAGLVRTCGQRLGGSPGQKRACIDLGGGITVTADGPSDYFFWGGVWSPDRRWVAFADTRSRLLVASADGRGPWRLDGRPARVMGWSR